ncbi:MAG: L-carnitine dehydratase/bile acid-inducible protein [Acidimicrobiales bacterium]|nr:L-carnitine dehydratase/bile acid-inducible protein [Acidimicrobiales bacterium]
MTTVAPLAGVRILEVSMLGPAALTTALAELGADVIKVEPPGGDYGREMTWPIVEDVSLLFLHANRGKRSLVLNLKDDGAKEVFRELAKGADAVVEAMRPGALARMGLGYEDLKKVNPAITFVSISGYGMTGPYKDMPSHGIAYDTWSGVVVPERRDDGHWIIPEHVSIGINAGPLYGALAVAAGIIQAKNSGEGAFLEIAQSDAAAAFDWYRIESHKAYERPQSEVTGNKSDNYERRPAGTAGMREGVRYQIYEAKGGKFVLFMASEQAFWKNFCEGVERTELFDKWPGSKFADHARGNTELQDQLREIFLSKTSDEWIAFGNEHNTPIAPVNTSQNVGDDPQFKARMNWIPKEQLGAEQMPSPIKAVGGAELPEIRKAPTVGQHNDEVLQDVLGYDAAKIAALRESGVLG